MFLIYEIENCILPVHIYSAFIINLLSTIFVTFYNLGYLLYIFGSTSKDSFKFKKSNHYFYFNTECSIEVEFQPYFILSFP